MSDINKMKARHELASQNEPEPIDKRLSEWEDAFGRAHQDRGKLLAVIDRIQMLVSDWQSQPEELLERGYVCTELSNALEDPCQGGGG